MPRRRILETRVGVPRQAQPGLRQQRQHAGSTPRGHCVIDTNSLCGSRTRKSCIAPSVAAPSSTARPEVPPATQERHIGAPFGAPECAYVGALGETAPSAPAVRGVPTSDLVIFSVWGRGVASRSWSLTRAQHELLQLREADRCDQHARRDLPKRSARTPLLLGADAPRASSCGR